MWPVSSRGSWCPLAVDGSRRPRNLALHKSDRLVRDLQSDPKLLAYALVLGSLLSGGVVTSAADGQRQHGRRGQPARDARPR